MEERSDGEAAGGRMTGGFLHVLPAVAYAAAVLTMGVTPQEDAPSPGVDDKTVHLIAFAVMTLLAARAARFLAPRRGVALHLLLAGAAAMGIGVLLEVLQAFTPDRTAELGDLLADLAGVLLMAGGLFLSSRLLRDGSAAAS
ncbi:MAG TPA: VanZ family protein [Polyangiaceae bacterium]|nr:VanZ family protein [Polyangiaceae bacterium]